MTASVAQPSTLVTSYAGHRRGRAVWNAGSNVLASRYNASTAMWGSPVAIDTEEDIVTEVIVEADGNGNFIAVWLQKNVVFTNRFSASTGAWGSRMILSNALPAFNPVLAVNADGRAVVPTPTRTTAASSSS